MNTDSEHPAPDCEKCRISKESSLKTNYTPTNCESEYSNIQVCMAANKGNIADCKIEWAKFKVCYDKIKQKH